MGDPNASIPTPQPVHYRYMFGAYDKANYQTSYTFVSQASLDNGIADTLSLNKMCAAVNNTREIRKSDLIHNSYQPKIEVDPQNL